MEGSSDEEDVHQCGRCKAIFKDIDTYFVHKKSKVCKKASKDDPSMVPVNGPDQPVFPSPSIVVEMSCEDETELIKAKEESATAAQVQESTEAIKALNGTASLEEIESECEPSTSIKSPAPKAEVYVDLGTRVDSVTWMLAPQPKRGRGRPKGSKTTNLKTKNPTKGLKVKVKAYQKKKPCGRSRGKPAGRGASRPRRGSTDSNLDGGETWAPKKQWMKDYSVDENQDGEEEGPPEDGKGGDKASRKKVGLRKMRRVKYTEYPAFLGKQLVQKKDQNHYPCPICDHLSMYKDEFDRHLRKEHCLSPYVCQRCAMGFRDKYKLTRHEASNACRKRQLEGQKEIPAFAKFYERNSVHNENNTVGNVSLDTSAENETGDGSKSDKRTSPMKRKPDFTCLECGTISEDFMELQNHMNQHPEIMPGICYFCGKWFSTKHKLWRHMTSAMHDDVPDSEMEKAKQDVQAMTVSWARPKGLMTSPVQKVPKCYKCGSVFPDREQLIEHSTKCTMAKKRWCFTCESCGEKFPRRNQMLKHMVNVHNIKDPNEYDFTCQVCDKSFRQKNHVIRHRETVHKPAVQVPAEELAEPCTGDVDVDDETNVQPTDGEMNAQLQDGQLNAQTKEEQMNAQFEDGQKDEQQGKKKKVPTATLR